jgi:glycine/D-amino acid oxidase-like deaminating enzyme
MGKIQLRGFNSQVLGSKELKDFHPYLRTEDLEGAIWVPEDAVAKPQAVCKALAKLAKEGGLYNPVKIL